MFLIESKLVRRIHQNEACSNIGRDNAAANNGIVFFATAVKLPCGLKQFEELAGGSPMLGIRRNRDHVRSLMTVLRSSLGWSSTAWTVARLVWTSSKPRAKPFRFELINSKSIASRDLEDLIYGIQKLRSFPRPGMVEVYPLAALRYFRDFLRMCEGVLNLAGKVCGIAKFEKDQVAIPEIILNSFRPGSDDWFA